ncbi:MAG: response regulator [Cyclobacteriaceae bacterium]
MPEKKKVLIVEDEAINAMFLKIMVSKCGYEVTGTAATGDVAIASVEGNSPDLILMDITLRNSIDGIQVANILREKHNFPIIFISGYDDKETLNRISLISNTWKLSKPIVENELTNLIDEVLLN